MPEVRDGADALRRAPRAGAADDAQSLRHQLASGRHADAGRPLRSWWLALDGPRRGLGGVRRSARQPRRDAIHVHELDHGDGRAWAVGRSSPAPRDAFARAAHRPRRGLPAVAPDGRVLQRSPYPRPAAPARFLHGGFGHLSLPSVGLARGGAVPGARGRAGAGAARVHASRLGGRRPVPASLASLAGLDAHHLRRGDRGPLHEAGEARGILVQRPRARPGPVELRLPSSRFLLGETLGQSGPAGQLAGLVRVPGEPGAPGGGGTWRPRRSTASSSRRTSISTGGTHRSFGSRWCRSPRTTSSSPDSRAWRRSRNPISSSAGCSDSYTRSRPSGRSSRPWEHARRLAGCRAI
jgi:hypothetical protein